MSSSSSIDTSSYLTITRTDSAAPLPGQRTEAEIAALRETMVENGVASSAIDAAIASIEASVDSVLTEDEVTAFQGLPGLSKGGDLCWSGLTVDKSGFHFLSGDSGSLRDVKRELDSLADLARSFGLLISGKVIQRGWDYLENNIFFTITENQVDSKYAVGFLLSDGSTVRL